MAALASLTNRRKAIHYAVKSDRHTWDGCPRWFQACFTQLTLHPRSNASSEPGRVTCPECQQSAYFPAGVK